MANFLRSKKGVVLSALLLLVISIVSIVYFKLNIGPFFNDSTVLLIQVDHEVETDNIANELYSFSKPSRIEKESTSKFYIHYQQITEEEKSVVLNTIDSKIPGLVTKTFYDYYPAKEILLAERAGIVAGSILLVAIVYMFVEFRKAGLLIKEVLSLLLKELLMTVYLILVLLGFVSIVGALGVVMESTFFILTITSVFIIVLFNIYYVFRFKHLKILNEKMKISEISQKISKDYWPEFVFLLAVVLVIFVLPWLVVSRDVTFGVIQILFAMLLIAYNFFILRENLLPSNLFQNKIFRDSKLLNKKW